MFPTFTLASVLIAQHIKLVDWTKIFKHFSEIIFIHASWYLANKHFDSIWIRFSLRGNLGCRIHVCCVAETIKKNNFWNVQKHMKANVMSILLQISNNEQMWLLHKNVDLPLQQKTAINKVKVYNEKISLHEGLNVSHLWK